MFFGNLNSSSHQYEKLKRECGKILVFPYSLLFTKKEP